MRKELEEILNINCDCGQQTKHKYIVDQILVQIKSEMMGCVPQQNKQLIPEWIRENVFNKGYNSAITETLARIELKFKEEVG